MGLTVYLSADAAPESGRAVPYQPVLLILILTQSSQQPRHEGGKFASG